MQDSDSDYEPKYVTKFKPFPKLPDEKPPTPVNSEECPINKKRIRKHYHKIKQDEANAYKNAKMKLFGNDY